MGITLSQLSGPPSCEQAAFHHQGGHRPLNHVQETNVFSFTLLLVRPLGKARRKATNTSSNISLEIHIVWIRTAGHKINSKTLREWVQLSWGRNPPGCIPDRSLLIQLSPEQNKGNTSQEKLGQNSEGDSPRREEELHRKPAELIRN